MHSRILCSILIVMLYITEFTLSTSVYEALYFLEKYSCLTIAENLVGPYVSADSVDLTVLMHALHFVLSSLCPMSKMIWIRSVIKFANQHLVAMPKIMWFPTLLPQSYQDELKYHFTIMFIMCWIKLILKWMWFNAIKSLPLFINLMALNEVTKVIFTVIF